MQVASLTDDVPSDLPEELVTILARGRDVRIERIVSTGQATPPGEWNDQAWHEWVLVVQGAARLRFEDAPAIELRAGQYVAIAAHRRHRVEWTATPTVWLAVHYA